MKEQWSMDQWMHAGAKTDLYNWIRKEAKRLGIPQGALLDKILRPVMQQAQRAEKRP